MTNHLPECPLATACKHDYYDEPPVQCANCGEECLCPALRACEQRVLRDAVNSDAVRGAIRIAEQRALDAARDAVAGVAVRKDTSHDMRVQALAAIDALRGSGNPHTPPSAEKGEQA